MTSEFETGLSTHAANDVALTVSNDGSVYRRARAAPSIISMELIIMDACFDYAVAQYGRDFTNAECDECIKYIIRAWTAE